MRTIAAVLGVLGGAASGVLGLHWMGDSVRPQAQHAMATLTGLAPWRLDLAPQLLLLAMLAGLAGGMLVHSRHGRVAAFLFLLGGIVPGMVDPRAFVATAVLVLAGILSLELAPTRAAPRLSPVAAPRTSQSFG